MPDPTPTARSLALADEIVTRIQALVTSHATVERIYDTPATEKELRLLTGRKVWVFPLTANTEALTRGRDQQDCEVAIAVVERYEDEGTVPTTWMDDRVIWTERLWDMLIDPRNTSTLGYWANEAGGRLPVYDPDILRGLSMFWVEFPPLIYRSIEAD